MQRRSVAGPSQRWRTLPVVRHRKLPTGRKPSIGAAAAKEVWLQTSNKETFTAALESGGVSAFVFGPDPQQVALAAEWSGLARFRAVLLDEDGELVEWDSGDQVGEVVTVDGPAAARALEARVQRAAGAGAEVESPTTISTSTATTATTAAAREEWVLVLDAQDWKVIPAENVVALAQAAGTSTSDTDPNNSPRMRLRLLAVADTCSEAQLMMEALEAGTAGVLLRTEDPGQVRSLASYVARRAAQEASLPDSRLRYEVATVRGVRPLGLGDRACVDLAGLLQPGEGLLVGSFARCLALVHSECGESDYIASRPFRVNAGPVHAYTSAPGGRTRYLSELASGSEVQVADAEGHTRTALVGRVKIERRPLVLVELETPSDGGRHSLMLQNAETVKLVGPAPARGATGKPWCDSTLPADSPSLALQGGGQAAAQGEPRNASLRGQCHGHQEGHGHEQENAQASGQSQGQRPERQGSSMGSLAACAGGVGDDEGGSSASGGSGGGWRAISVSTLEPGDRVYVLLQGAARHTGIAIEEFIVEK